VAAAEMAEILGAQGLGRAAGMMEGARQADRRH
jgi:hypothetical protein